MNERFPKVSADGMAARVLLAFLATAGLYYVNIMPAIVDGLKEGLGFSNKEAGLVASCNVYGAALGSFVIAFFVRRIDWRIFAPGLLLGLIGMDLLSMTLAHPVPLMVARFAHGTIGGVLVGIGFSVIARTKAPDRTFGILLLVQAFAGGLGVMSLPLLVGGFGTQILFWALIAFSALTLLLIQFLPEYRREVGSGIDFAVPEGKVQIQPLLFALVSVFLFQAANMGLYAFIIGLGKNEGLDIAFIGETLGAANWIAILGALLVVALSTRVGLVIPLLTGMILTIFGTWLLLYASSSSIWIAANVITAITWNLVIAYLLGMCARFDTTGETAVWGGFASKMGLASGPMLASFIVGESQYQLLIIVMIALLVLGMICSVIPARLLDAQTRRASNEAKLGVPAAMN